MDVRSTEGNSLFFATGMVNNELQGGANKATGMIQNFAINVAKINPFAALVVVL